MNGKLKCNWDQGWHPEINEIPVIGWRIQSENDPMKPNEREIHVRVEVEITDEERLIIGGLKLW